MDEIERPKRSPKKRVDPDFEYDTVSACSKGLLEPGKSSAHRNRMTKKDSKRIKKGFSENEDCGKGKRETNTKQKGDLKSDEKNIRSKVIPFKALQNGVQKAPIKKILKGSLSKANKIANQNSDMISNPEKIFHDKSSQLDGKGGHVKVICNSKFYTNRLIHWKNESFKYYTEKFKKKLLCEKPTFEAPQGGFQLKLIHQDFKTTISFWTRRSIVVVQGQYWEQFMKEDFIELKKRIENNISTTQDTSKTASTSPARKRSRLSLKATRENGNSPAVQKLTSLFDQTDKANKNKDDMKSPFKKFDSSKTHPPSVAALHNLGNTCYLNSVLQVLRFTPGFTDALQKLSEEISICEEEKEAICQSIGEEYDDEDILTWKFVKHLQELYKKMKKAEEKHRYGNSHYIAVRPYDVIYTIEKINPMFEGNLQHDAHELLRCVLAYVQDATKEVNKHRKEENMLQAKEVEEEPVAESEIVEIADARDEKILSPQKLPPEKSMNTKLVKTSALCQDSSKLSSSEKISCKMESMQGAPVLNGERYESCDSDEVVLFDSFMNGYSSDKENHQSLTHCGSTVADKESVEKDHTYSSPKKEDKKEDNSHLTTDNRKRKYSTGNEPVTNSFQGSKNMKRQKNGRQKNSKGKKGNANGKIDSTQPKISTILDESKNMKRLGVRGSLVTRESDLDPCSRVNGDDSISGVQVSAQAKRALEKQQKLEMKTKQTARKTLGAKGACAQDEDKTNFKTGESPKGEMAKIEAELKKINVNTQMKSPNTEMKYEAKKHGESAVVKLTPSDMKHYYPIVNKAKQPTAFKKRNTEMIEDCVEHLFQGYMTSRIQCNECECFTERKEEYQDTCVPVRKEKTDDDDDEGGIVVGEEKKHEGPSDWIFEALEEVEKLVDDNKYFCDQCLRLVEAERSMHYTTLPEIFTLHLKRFATTSGYYGGVTKINDFVTTPMELPCIKDRCKDECSQTNHRYELYALIIHTGISLSSGHYVSYVKAPRSIKQLTAQAGVANQKILYKEEVQEKEMAGPSTSMMLADPNNNADDNNNLDDTIPNANLVAMETNQVNTENVTNEMKKGLDDSNEDDIWYECDDDTIRELKQAELEYLLSASGGVTPYLLFYKLRK